MVCGVGSNKGLSPKPLQVSSAHDLSVGADTASVAVPTLQPRLYYILKVFRLTCHRSGESV